MTLSILIWLPLAISLLAPLLPPRLVGRGRRSVGSLVTLGVAISFVARFKLGHVGLQFVTDKVWISALGIHYKLGLDGLNVVLVLLTTVLFSAVAAVGVVPRVGAPADASTSTSASPRAPCSAPSAPRTWRCSSRFFDLMLIPFYFLTGMLGHRRPGAGDDQARRLHARSGRS